MSQQYIYTYTIFRIFFNLEMPGRTLQFHQHLICRENIQMSEFHLELEEKESACDTTDGTAVTPGVPSSWATSNIHCPK